MKQKLSMNSKYEILTPFGWEDFKGVLKNEGEKEGVILSFKDGSTIEATTEHRFYINNKEVRADTLSVGDKLDSDGSDKEIVSIEKTILETSYDIFDTPSHTVYTNGVKTHQCDEFAFVRPNLANEFWTSIQPVLSTGGACIITSTPKSDEDQFAQIWKGAINNTDEFGNTLPNGEGRNGFFPIKVKWDAHPERDESWAEPFRNSLGPAKFAQEFECVIGDTMLDLTNANDEWQMMSIGDLYEYLKGKNANGKHV